MITIMATLKDLIRNKFNNDGLITIPWNLHGSITFEDIAFVSMRTYLFRLDDEYYSHINSEKNYQHTEFLRISERFDNYENTCFLFVILQKEWRDNIYGMVLADDPEPGFIFSREFCDKAWDYVIEHNLNYRLFGAILIKIRYTREVNDEPFMYKYLGILGTKKARSDSGFDS